MSFRATYRLQLSPEQDFAAALELVPYLKELGISHLYLSPSLQARPGSTHGYDVCDPTRISADLGGEEAFRALAGAGLGVVLDIVPNHMGAFPENPWWADPELRERFFDIDEETGFVRRFFDVDDLAAVRMEREEVFEVAHRKVFELLEDGVLSGLRVDHPDGLADPAGYLARLQERAPGGSVPVWVEKILHPGEPLPDWPVAGTVGYEFLDDAAALYVDPAGAAPLLALWSSLTGDDRSFEAVALEGQLQQAEGTFKREVDWLVRLSGERFSADVLARALAQIPVYRAYVEPWSGAVSDQDRAVVAQAGLPDELARVLLLEERGLDEFVTRFQQTTPPVTAKGIEDTTFYRYMPMLALNEVGGDPARFGLSVAEFHATQAVRAERFGLGLLVTQTHDTKRSGDSRARIGALAGIAEEWEAFVRSQLVDTLPAAEQLLVLQTLVGIGEVTRERLDAYLEKALREGKTTSNWIDPDEAHERAVQDWAWERFLDPAVQAFVERVAPLGERAALGQTLLKLTSPGVPDVYQGDELWALSLVDPDNRRAVDFDARRTALAAARAGEAPTRATVKLHLIHRALALRERQPDAFGPDGSYRPLELSAAAGGDADPGEHACAYARGDSAIVVVPIRRFAHVALTVPEEARGAWRCALSGRELTLGAAPLLADLAPGGAYGELVLLERA